MGNLSGKLFHVDICNAVLKHGVIWFLKIFENTTIMILLGKCFHVDVQYNFRTLIFFILSYLKIRRWWFCLENNSIWTCNTRAAVLNWLKIGGELHHWMTYNCSNNAFVDAFTVGDCSQTTYYKFWMRAQNSVSQVEELIFRFSNQSFIQL